MDVGLVEHHGLTVAPVIALAVDVDVAPFIIRRFQAQVVTVTAGIRIPMANQPGARWQLGEHRGLDRTDALHQLRGKGAQLGGRGVTVAIPLQIKTLPAGLEERVEAHVVVLIRTLDLPGPQQALSFGADCLPVGLQRAQVRKISGVQVRLVGEPGEQIEEAVDRRQEA
ncbi:hypothetical protein D3C84_776540 [compost metagenome]